MDAPLQKVYVNGGEITQLIDELQPIFAGKPRLHIMLACLTMAVIMQDPDISSDNLKKTIEGTSEYIGLVTSTFKDFNLDEPTTVN